jgi:hypothetical protein
MNSTRQLPSTRIRNSLTMDSTSEISFNMDLELDFG